MSGIIAAVEIFEPREFLQEGKFYGTGRAVSLLGDYQLGHAFVLVGLVVIIFAKYERDHIGVLLDTSRFARSESNGLGGFRASGARESCDRASTGTFNSLARALSSREICETSCWRDSIRREPPPISWR